MSDSKPIFKDFVTIYAEPMDSSIDPSVAADRLAQKLGYPNADGFGVKVNPESDDEKQLISLVTATYQAV